jgi:hypothetical protein
MEKLYSLRNQHVAARGARKISGAKAGLYAGLIFLSATCTVGACKSLNTSIAKAENEGRENVIASFRDAVNVDGEEGISGMDKEIFYLRTGWDPKKVPFDSLSINDMEYFVKVYGGGK